MTIREGQAVPFGYGLVRVRWDMFNAYEVAPIPICWIKRFWYWTLHKMKPFDWEKKLAGARKKDRQKIKRIADNLDGIYIRAKVDGAWGSFSLSELMRSGNGKQAMDWICKI